MENSALIPEATTMYTNKEALKDVKDLSKNLMSGDFERQYNGSESGRKRKGCVILGVTVGALAVWLLVLTIVREIQVTQLRQEVDQLSVNMIAMSANVMSLNQKLSSNRLFNEFKTLEDTIYADEDQEGNVVHDDKDLDKDTQNVESLDKLSGLTVLEDESMLDDDEDLYDGDEDAESGDWYPDYDRRREKVGTTNMVRLKPEDFVDSVSKQDIPKISHMLNENPELTDILPALAASPSSTGDPREKRSLLSAGTTENDFLPTVSKVEERRKIKKFSPTESSKPSTKTVSRTARNSNEQDRRPFIAAHFHGNTSHLNTNIHKQYKGNGLLHVSHDAPHNVWYPASWTLASPPASAGTGGRPTLFPSGHVHVRETGIYFVYVQIYYLDIHDVISWVLHRTRGNWDKERDTLLQCSQSAHSNELLDKPNSCFSAAALFLREGDRLAVRNIYGERHSIMQPEKSFIGLIKLADAEEPNYEM